jgi:hypothetical protein
MRSNLLNRVYVIAAVATVGCAGAQVKKQSSASPITTARPTQVFMYPFAVNASDVSLNSSIFQIAYRNMTDGNKTAEQAQVAHHTSQNICIQDAADLTQRASLPLACSAVLLPAETKYSYWMGSSSI